MSAARIGGIVLAAGAGTRMGTPKAVVELDGRLLVERAVDLLAASGCDPIVVVLGAAAADVRRRAELAGVEAVLNADWATGMGSSLRAGLAALDGRADAAAIVLADQPRITPAAVTAVIDAWRSGDRPAATATFEGRQRPPVVLGADVWTEVAATATGDVGARTWLRRFPQQVLAVPCDGLADPIDVDTPEDLASLIP